MMNKHQYPLKRQNLADEVVKRLQEKITEGEFAIGQKLPPEPALMELFGVGRSTIREAVRILANAGLVRVQQGSGTFVEEREGITEPLMQRLLRAKGQEINEVRQLLELKIAEKAALNRTEKDIKKISHHLAERHRLALANLPLECIQADIDFHVSIAEASKNDILADLYKTVACHLRNYFMEIFIDTEPLLKTQEWHEGLLQSIKDKDPKQAWERAAKITGQQH